MNFVLIVFALIAFAQAENESSTISESVTGRKEGQGQMSGDVKIPVNGEVFDNTGRSSIQSSLNDGFNDYGYQNFNGFTGQNNFDSINVGGSSTPSIDFAKFENSGMSSNPANDGLKANIFSVDQQGAQQGSSIGNTEKDSNDQNSLPLKSEVSEKDSGIVNEGSMAFKTMSIAQPQGASSPSFAFANSVFPTPSSYENGFDFTASNLFNTGFRSTESPFANFEKIITSNAPSASSTNPSETEESSKDDLSRPELKFSNNLQAIPSVSEGLLNGRLFKSGNINPEFNFSNNEFLSTANNNQQNGNELSMATTKLSTAEKELKGEINTSIKDVSTSTAAPTNPTLSSFAPDSLGNIDASLFGSNNYPQFNSFNELGRSIFSTSAPSFQAESSSVSSTPATSGQAKAGAVPTNIPSDAVTISTPEVTIPTPTGKTTVDTSIVKSGLPALNQFSNPFAPESTLTTLGSTISPFINSASYLSPSFSYPFNNPIYSGFLPSSSPFIGSFGIGAPVQTVFPQFPLFPTQNLPTTDSSISFQPPNTVMISGDSVSVSAPNVESSVPTPIEKPLDQTESPKQPENEQVVEIAGSAMKSSKTSGASDSEKNVSKSSIDVTLSKENAALNSEKSLAHAFNIQSGVPSPFLSSFYDSFPTVSSPIIRSFYGSTSFLPSSTSSYLDSNFEHLSIPQYFSGYGSLDSIGSGIDSISTSNIFKKKRQS